MKKHYYLTYTFFSNAPELNSYVYSTSVKNRKGSKIHTIKSYEEAMKVLRQLEKKLGRSADLTINRYTTNIFYKELHGWVEE